LIFSTGNVIGIALIQGLIAVFFSVTPEAIVRTTFQRNATLATHDRIAAFRTVTIKVIITIQWCSILATGHWITALRTVANVPVVTIDRRRRTPGRWIADISRTNVGIITVQGKARLTTRHWIAGLRTVANIPVITIDRR